MKKTLQILIVFAFFGLNANAQNFQWVQKANFGGGVRAMAAGFSIGTKGYIGTGSDGTNFRNDFWEYDPSTDAWTQKADFGGVTRVQAIGFSIGSKGYIGLGTHQGGTFQGDFWEYDPSNNIWTQKANFGGTSRVSAVGFSIGTKGYVGTGSNLSGNTNDFWQFNPSNNTWTQLTGFPGGIRNSAVAFSIGSKGYVGTGANSAGELNDFYSYDSLSGSWTTLTNFPGAVRQNAVGISNGAKGYIATGLGNQFYTDFWEYDPTSLTWIQKTDFAGGTRYGAVGFAIGSNIFIGTGQSNQDFWEWEIVCNQNITTQPLNQSINMNTNAHFSVTDSINGCSYQWQLNNGTGYVNLFNIGPYSGVNTDTLHISNVQLSMTNYYYRCIINCGTCSDTSNAGILTVINNTGISQINTANSISIFPNPATTLLNIHHSTCTSPEALLITDLLGTVVYKEELHGIDNTISISTWSAGIYFYEVGSNTDIARGKFVVQR